MVTDHLTLQSHRIRGVTRFLLTGCAGASGAGTLPLLLLEDRFKDNPGADSPPGPGHIPTDGLIHASMHPCGTRLCAPALGSVTRRFLPVGTSPCARRASPAPRPLAPFDMVSSRVCPCPCGPSARRSRLAHRRAALRPSLSCPPPPLLQRDAPHTVSEAGWSRHREPPSRRAAEMGQLSAGVSSCALTHLRRVPPEPRAAPAADALRVYRVCVRGSHVLPARRSLLSLTSPPPNAARVAPNGPRSAARLPPAVRARPRLRLARGACVPPLSCRHRSLTFAEISSQE